MIANIFGGDLPIVLLVALVVLFGGSQLPKIARNVGSAGKEFRKAQQEAEEDHARASAATPVAPVAVAPAPPVTLSPPVAPAPVATSDDQMVVSRTDLKQELASLLDEREKRTGQ